MESNQEPGKYARLRPEHDAGDFACFDELGMTRIVQAQDEVALRQQLA